MVRAVHVRNDSQLTRDMYGMILCDRGGETLRAQVGAVADQEPPMLLKTVPCDRGAASCDQATV